MKRLLLSTLVLPACSLAFAADLPTFNPQHLSDEVKALSSDAFEGRGPATPAEAKTVDYIIEGMKQAGLEPGGDLNDGERTWTQAVPLLRSEIAGTPTLTLTVDGSASADPGRGNRDPRTDGWLQVGRRQGRAAGVCRLWRQCARARLG